MTESQIQKMKQQIRKQEDDPMECAKVGISRVLSSIDSLDIAVRGAVYLNDEGFRSASHVATLSNTNRKQQQQIARLKEQMETSRVALAKSAHRCKALEDRALRAEQALSLISMEQESTTKVFQMHYEEIMLKQNEIVSLKQKIVQLNSIIEVMDGQKQASKTTLSRGNTDNDGRNHDKGKNKIEFV